MAETANYLGKILELVDILEKKTLADGGNALASAAEDLLIRKERKLAHSGKSLSMHGRDNGVIGDLVADIPQEASIVRKELAHFLLEEMEMMEFLPQIDIERVGLEERIEKNPAKVLNAVSGKEKQLLDATREVSGGDLPHMPDLEYRLGVWNMEGDDPDLLKNAFLEWLGDKGITIQEIQGKTTWCGVMTSKMREMARSFAQKSEVKGNPPALSDNEITMERLLADQVEKSLDLPELPEKDEPIRLKDLGKYRDLVENHDGGRKPEKKNGSKSQNGKENGSKPQENKRPGLDDKKRMELMGRVWNSRREDSKVSLEIFETKNSPRIKMKYSRKDRKDGVLTVPLEVFMKKYGYRMTHRGGEVHFGKNQGAIDIALRGNPMVWRIVFRATNLFGRQNTREDFGLKVLGEKVNPLVVSKVS